MTNKIHTPVLLHETIRALNINPNGIYVDVTAGFGGHSQAILDKLSKQGKLICIDQDSNATEYLNKRFANNDNVSVINNNFINIRSVFSKNNINKVDGVIADLGVSSLMLDDPKRGFSYHEDGPLDMRMDQTQELDAYYVVNKYSKAQLINIFKKYGEAHEANAVASKIVEIRKVAPIESTLQLVDVIKTAVSKKTIFKHKHPARIYFQAIRMEVNHELEVLTSFINEVVKYLKVNGIIAIITFHSLEDRIVKTIFNKLTISSLPKEIPIQQDPNVKFALVNKKPIVPTEQEIDENKRSHSAKLRVLKRIKE